MLLSAPLAEVQATRAVLILSIFLSAMAVITSTVGMKCTHFMDDKPRSKSTIAMIAGIMFVVSGMSRGGGVTDSILVHCVRSV